MRILLDTNVLITLEDSGQILGRSYAQLFQLATANNHQLLVHPASIDDIRRDKDLARRQSTLSRLEKYPSLDQPAVCPWNDATTSANDVADNALLYAVESDAVHALVTEDQGLHRKAARRGLRERVFYVQTAEDWLRRLHGVSTVSLPNIEDVPLHQLVPELGGAFFDSLRGGYGTQFNHWFRAKSQEGRRAWLHRSDDGSIGALCIYALQNDQTICDDGTRLQGRALKICTFKVGESHRGRKVGELFLKAAFRFASTNQATHVFIEVQADKHSHLIDLLEDFGFSGRGKKGEDSVYVKQHPTVGPTDSAVARFDYHRRYYPHFLLDASTQAFLVPIVPGFHDTLLPDCPTTQQRLFAPVNPAGNAIKLAYLCHAPTTNIRPGDLAFFYRSHDEMAITSLGVVESYSTSKSADQIAALVSRRTVYNLREISELASKPTRVMLFRLALHLKQSVPHTWLIKNGVVNGNIQSITKIDTEKAKRILTQGGAPRSDLHSS